MIYPMKSDNLFHIFPTCFSHNLFHNLSYPLKNKNNTAPSKKAGFGKTKTKPMTLGRRYSLKSIKNLYLMIY